MNQTTESLKKVYKKDGEGATYAVSQTVFEGQTVEFASGWPDMGRTLTEMKSFIPHDDDVMLITYPRSGTHWMYQILCCLIRGRLTHYEDPSRSRVFEILESYDRSKHGDESAIYYTHIRKKYMPEHILKKLKVIYVVRNPKSVAVSYHSLETRLKSSEYEGTFDGFFPVFMKGLYSLRGNWFQHVTEYWSELKEQKNAYFVFFEELKKDPRREIMKISEFLGCGHDKTFCEEIVRLTTVANMRNVEQGEKTSEINQLLWKKDAMGLVREGTIDGWKKYFTKEQSETLDVVYHEALQEYPELKNRIQFN